MSKKAELESKGYKAYEGEQIWVFWNPKLCTHATKCWRANRAVFNPAKRPWVNPNAAPAKEIAEIIDTCPSAALLYEWKTGGDIT